MASNRHISVRYKADRPWQEAHERFTRNQEYRVKKFGLSKTAQKYIAELRPDEVVEVTTKCLSRHSANPYEDSELTKSIALAEHRNINLNETQQMRVEIARRRQGNYVAKGHAFDNEHVLKRHVLPYVPKTLDLKRAMMEDLTNTVRDNMHLLKTDRDGRAKRRPAAAVNKDDADEDFELELDFENNSGQDNLNYLTEAAPLPTSDFRLKYQEKPTAVTEILPSEYKNLVSPSNRNKQMQVYRLLDKCSSDKKREIKRKDANYELQRKHEQDGLRDQFTTGKLLYGVNEVLPTKFSTAKNREVQLTYGKIQENIRVLMT